MTKTLTLRSLADVPGIVRQFVGFTPVNSIVALYIGPRQFAARLDLAGEAEMAKALIEPGLRYEAEAVVLVSYGGDLGNPLGATRLLAQRFEEAGIRVALLADVRIVGTIAQIRDSRGNEGLATVEVDDFTREQIAEDLRPKGTLAPPNLAERKRIFENLSRDTAKHYMETLVPRLKEAPAEPETGALAELVALAAWLSGDGAKAWIMVDLARELAKPDDPPALAELVAHVLDNAIDPNRWGELSQRVAS